MTSFERAALQDSVPEPVTAPPHARRQRRPFRLQVLEATRLAIGLAAMLLMAALCLQPFLWMISTSLQDLDTAFTLPPQMIPRPAHWSNYRDVMTAIPFLTYTRNTAFITLTVTAGQVLTCSMAAYAFARMRWAGRDRIFLLWLGTMMIPGQVTLIPNYILMAKIGWINSYKALIVPGVLGGVYGAFLMRQFMLSIPQELEDAAAIDGASPIRVYSTIMMPLCKPVLATYGVFTFMGVWNDFLWPLLMLNSPDKLTLTVGIGLMATRLFSTDWPHLMAGTCMSVIPVVTVFLAAQRFYVQGITLTGVKA